MDFYTASKNLLDSIPYRCFVNSYLLAIVWDNISEGRSCVSDNVVLLYVCVDEEAYFCKTWVKECLQPTVPLYTGVAVSNFVTRATDYCQVRRITANAGLRHIRILLRDQKRSWTNVAFSVDETSQSSEKVSEIHRRVKSSHLIYDRPMPHRSNNVYPFNPSRSLYTVKTTLPSNHAPPDPLLSEP
jgi:hypothetical protein